jgi:chromosome segregation ATPase
MFNQIGAYLIIGLLAFGALSSLYAANQHLKNEVLQVSIERDNAKAAFQSKKLEADNSKAAQTSLENLLTQQNEATKQLEQDLENLRNEPESDNGAVSPLLQRGISGLRGDD